MKQNQTKIVNCPTCKKEIHWIPENTYRPFCCERCKLIDLGQWAAEQHVIPAPITSQSYENESEEVYHLPHRLED
jgi:uncharacterized protein